MERDSIWLTVDCDIKRLFTLFMSLVNMSLFHTKDLGSEENGLVELKRLGGGTFGVVYLDTGVRGQLEVYLPTPGLISYRSSLES